MIIFLANTIRKCRVFLFGIINTTSELLVNTKKIDLLDQMHLYIRDNQFSIFPNRPPNNVKRGSSIMGSELIRNDKFRCSGQHRELPYATRSDVGNSITPNIITSDRITSLMKTYAQVEQSNKTKIRPISQINVMSNVDNLQVCICSLPTIFIF